MVQVQELIRFSQALWKHFHQRGLGTGKSVKWQAGVGAKGNSGVAGVIQNTPGAIALNGINLDKNLAEKDPNPTAKGSYPIATLTWILAYEKGNGRNTKAIKKSLSKLLSDEYQDKAPSLGFVPLKRDILGKSRAAVKKK